ncbi:MAG: acyl-CoA/acyl-ACP dehydrogenase [Pseudonocardia sp.]|nr:acyl-CoA/acyl-ACP dehydrogenase [Pseudonocardia sp.]
MSAVLDFVRPRLAGWHEVGHVPADDWRALAGLVPIGTRDLREVDRVLSCLVETRDVGLAGAFAINEIGARLLDRARATDLLPAVEAGEVRLAVALTERASGSDLGAMSTHVQPGDPPTLLGTKSYIANGSVADVHLVAARAGDGGASLPLIDLYRVDRADVHTADLGGAGARLMRLADIRLDGAPAPPERRIGRAGRGFSYLTEVLLFERAIIGCLGVHVGRVLLQDLGAHLSERTVFGTRLDRHGHHRLRLGAWWAEQRNLAAAARAVVDGVGAGCASWQDVYAIKLGAAAFVRKLAVEMQHVGGADAWVKGGSWTHAVDDVRWLGIAGGASEVLQDRLAQDALEGTG